MRSFIYQLPIEYQDRGWRCWLISAAVVNCSNDADNDYEVAKERVINGIREHSELGQGYLDNIMDNIAVSGILPQHIPLIFTQANLRAVDPQIVSRIINAGDVEVFVRNIEQFLLDYGPLVIVRRALGNPDALHAEPIVGITYHRPTSDNPSGAKIWVHNSMQGVLFSYNPELVKDLISDTPTVQQHLWYNRSHVNQTRLIATRNLEGFDCIEQQTTGLIQYLTNKCNLG